MEKETVVGRKAHTLGKVQLRHQDTNEILLMPTPSDDPRDPLNWSNAQKYYLTGLICFGVFFVNFAAAGPAVALEQIAIEFFGPSEDPSTMIANISTVSYIQTVSSLCIGVGNLIWVPLAIKYGRRPVFIASWLLMTGSTIWGGCAKSFGSELAARTVYGLAGAAPELVAVLVLTDIFFLHQRGAVMILYTCALTSGVGLGICFSGLLTMHHDWRYIFWLCTAVIGACTILVIFTLPETNWQRQSPSTPVDDVTDSKTASVQEEDAPTPVSTTATPPNRKSHWHWDLRPFSGTFTHESLATLVFRQIIAIALPAVLWASLVNAVTIGVVVLISTNFTAAFGATYGFQPYQSGLTYLSSVVGALIAILAGGSITDKLADKLTIKNGGVRTPEMRLPLIIIPLITGPLACMLYGVGVAKSLHWICPVFGIGLVAFTTVQSTNVAMVYILDSYRPIAGEVVVTQAVFRAALGFLINFYANPWIQEQGPLQVFGILAGISGGIFLFAFLFYVVGGRLRIWSWHWRLTRKYLHWDIDREVGE